jgi:hypothetical protein
VPGPGALAVAGLMLFGLAAAPVFPLFTLTTGQRAGTARMVSLQVAASAVGSAALPAGLGLAVGAVGAWILAPSLLPSAWPWAASTRSCRERSSPADSRAVLARFRRCAGARQLAS